MNTKKDARWQAGEECFSRSDSNKPAPAWRQWARDAAALRIAVAQAYAMAAARKLVDWVRTAGRGPKGRA